MVDVLLVAMPWERIDCPSLPLGILKAVLEDAGISSAVRHYQLDFLDICLSATAENEHEEQLDPGDYKTLMLQDTGLNEWVFAVPPLIDLPAENEQKLLDHLRAEGVSEETIARARLFRMCAPQFLKNCVEDAQKLQPRIIGFTMGGPYLGCLALAKMLKADDPSLTVVCGGAACNGPMGAAMHRAFPWVDLVVRGEGEPVLPALVRDLLGGRPITPHPGLCYRQDGRSVAEPEAFCRVKLDEIPTPIYDDYYEHLQRVSFGPELENEGTILLESARGCWWSEHSQCTFCGIYTEASKFRTKSTERTINELAELSERYERLDFEYVNFLADAAHSPELWSRIKELQSDLEMDILVRPTISKEQLRQMRDAGFTTMRCGLESLSTPVLKLMHKGTTALRNIRFLKWCTELGITVRWNLIYGMPGEPQVEYQCIADLMRSLTHLQPPRLLPLMMNRFSPHFRQPQEFGLELGSPLPYYRLLLPCDLSILEDLAYYFEYKHRESLDIESYMTPVHEVVELWKTRPPGSSGDLRYRKGRGFLLVEDTRHGLNPSTYRFADVEGHIYLACDEGARIQDINCPAGISDQDIKTFLTGLVEERLVYEERGCYLSLAISSDRLSGRLS